MMIAPRRCLPLDDWPEADRMLWERVSDTADFFSEDIGRPAHWRTATRRKTIMLYGRWLSYTIAAGLVTDSQHPCDRITPEAVRGYILELQESVASWTVWSYAVVLHQMARAFGPGDEWTWLYKITARLGARRRPVREKLQRMRPASEVAAWAQGELQRLNEEGIHRPYEAKAYRDALMVGLLIDCPVRLRNLVMIRIGGHLQRIGDAYVLRFKPDEVKNHRHLTMEIGRHLSPFIDAWLDDVRPILDRSDGAEDRLWLGVTGAPLGARGIHKSISDVTTRAFGAPINPHLFRDIAATSVAIDDPAHVGIAGSLLGHVNPRTAKDHYIHADQVSAGRRHRAAVEGLRRSLSQDLGRRA